MRLWIFGAALAYCLLPAPAAGQGGDVDRVIQSLEVNESVAMLRADTATLSRIWAEDLVVTNPNNQLVTRDAVLEGVRSGRIAYSLFERYVEAIREYGDAVVVVGTEAVVPEGDRPDAGRLADRRFTHVWIRTPAGWRLAVRHASRGSPGAGPR